MMEKADSASIAALWERFEERGPEPVLAALPAHSLQTGARQTLQALALFSAGEFAAAAQAFERCIAEDGQNPVARLYLALALYQSGDPRAAGDALGRAVILPHSQWLKEFLRIFWPKRLAGEMNAILNPTIQFSDPFADDYRRWKDHEADVSAEELEDEPNHGAIRQMASAMARLTSDRGKLHKATRALGDRYAARAVAAYQSGKLPDAIRLFQRAREVRPLSEEITANLAYLYLLAGRGAEALPLLEAAAVRAMDKFDRAKDAELLPQPDTVVCLAWSLHEAGEHRKALELLSGIRPEGPDDWGSHFVAAVCWLMLGDEKHYSDALRAALGPYFIDTWEQLLRPFVMATGEWLREEGK
ncbi:hypothetical protein BH09SUM1_BH09SUM1_06090 [soil metagenome]